MKAQISLELLIYLSLSSFSIVFAAGAIMHYAPIIKKELGAYEVWQLIERLDVMAWYYTNGSVHAYIPKGLCNSSLEGDNLVTEFGSFYIDPALKLDNPFCPDGTYANLSVNEGGGFTVVGRLHESAN
ncbi:MAG: hypothetical protein ACP5P2_02310 [Candidatus Micrarchaeia archaeon]|jgi:hypothetical protein